MLPACYFYVGCLPVNRSIDYQRTCMCSGVEMMEMGRNVEDLWEKAMERFPTSMTALSKSFDDDFNKAKSIVRQSLTGKNTCIL